MHEKPRERKSKKAEDPRPVGGSDVADLFASDQPQVQVDGSSGDGAAKRAAVESKPPRKARSKSDPAPVPALAPVVAVEGGEKTTEASTAGAPLALGVICADARVIDKNVDYIVMVPSVQGNPRAAKITLTGRKIYDAMLWLAREQYTDSSKEAVSIAPGIGGRLFGAYMLDILDIPGLRREVATAKAKDMVIDLQEVSVEWRSLVSRDVEEEFRIFNLFSEVRFTQQAGGKMFVQWAYPPTVAEHIMDPRIFARIDFQMLNAMSTYAARVLYEICSRYKRNPLGATVDGARTAENNVDWWVEACSMAPIGYEREIPVEEAERSGVDLLVRLAGVARLLGHPVVRVPKRKLIPWPQFKAQYIARAINEINERSDLMISLVEKKEGKRVVAAYFRVVMKSERDAAVDIGVRQSLLDQMKSLGIGDSRAQSLLGQYSEIVLGRAIGRIAEIKSGSGGAPGQKIRSMGAYLSAVATDIDRGQGTDLFSGDAPPPPDLPVAASAPERVHAPASPAIVQTPVAESSSSPGEESIDPFRTKIQGMVDATREELFMLALDRIPAEMKVRPHLRKKIAEREWTSPLIFNAMKAEMKNHPDRWGVE